MLFYFLYWLFDNLHEKKKNINSLYKTHVCTLWNVKLESDRWKQHTIYYGIYLFTHHVNTFNNCIY